MARHSRNGVNKRRTSSRQRNQTSLPSLESLPSLTNQSVNMLVDSVIQRQGVALKKPKLSMQEKRQLRNLLMDLQDKVEKLSKNTKE